MSTTRDISRRVGVCAARNRASAVRCEDALLRSGRPRLVLAHAGFHHLIPVEAAVFAQQRAAERRDQRRGVAAALEVAVRDRAGLVDAALQVPARLEIVERTRRRSGRTRRRAR